MADVFISYSRDNEAVVRGLAQAVAGEGYGVWWDDALPPHLSYGDVISAEIGAAKAVIVVWSETAIASEWVRAEADLARNQKKLVQTSIDGRMPPMPFNQLHFVSIGDWRGEPDHPGWMRVKESLASLCRGEVTQSSYAFPKTAPPRPAPAAAQGNPALRLAAFLVVGLLLFGAIAAAAFWLLRGPEGGEANQRRPPAALQGSAPSLSAPVGEPSRAEPPSTTRAKPANVAPRPAASEPVRTQPTPTLVRQPQVQQRAPTQIQPANMRRYCNGPGRGTPQCRRWRQQMSNAN